ncbi:hypothetical protein H9P43_001806 [Blastocladiella emersonii ATCC 22665]|nr:hypothetical protein H9P43_001806 [Blastocladiella emersonii ATCC 22665]
MDALYAELGNASATGDLGAMAAARTAAAPEMIKFGAQEKLMRTKANVKSERQRYFAELVNAARGFEGRRVIFLIGHATDFASAPAHHSGPVKELVRTLRKNRIPVYMINECYSSKRCAACSMTDPAAARGECNLVQTGSWRDKSCPCCKFHYHRDLNACLNIAMNALDMLEIAGRPRPVPLVVSATDEAPSPPPSPSTTSRASSTASSLSPSRSLSLVGGQ